MIYKYIQVNLLRQLNTQYQTSKTYRILYVTVVFVALHTSFIAYIAAYNYLILNIFYITTE